MPLSVAVPVASAVAGLKTVLLPPASTTTKPSAPPLPPSIVPLRLLPARNVKTSLLTASRPTRFSNAAKATPSTVPALAAEISQPMRTPPSPGPSSLSAKALPTSASMPVKAATAVAVAPCRSTCTAAPRAE